MGWSNIAIRDEVKRILDQLKLTPRESYNDVIQRMVKEYQQLPVAKELKKLLK